MATGAGRAAPPPARLRSGLALARRAAEAYAAGAYRRRPPVLPEETGAVSLALAAAARRVPPVRRGLHPVLLGLRFHVNGVDRVATVASIGGRAFPTYTIGLELRWRHGWRVAGISLPD